MRFQQRRPYVGPPRRWFPAWARTLLFCLASLLGVAFVAGNVLLMQRSAFSAKLEQMARDLAHQQKTDLAARAELQMLRTVVEAAGKSAVVQTQDGAAPHNPQQELPQPVAGAGIGLPPLSPLPERRAVSPHLTERRVVPRPSGLPSPGPLAAHQHSIEAAPKDPSRARALLIVCYNRPQYLARTLGAVLDRLPSYNRPHVYVSQDGAVDAVTSTINTWREKFRQMAPDVPFTHWKHSEPANLRGAAQWATGYYKLSQHFGWGLDRLFIELKHPRVILLEDDLEVAVDFFDYFTATESLLDSDRSLLAVSAWSDIGQAAFVADPARVLRSDFFPGLGWMLSKHAWEELGPKWPLAFWDDWLREPPQRQGRAFLRPEVSRTYTFGSEGTSNAQYFEQYLANIKLNDVPVDWAGEDLTYLEKATFDAELEAALESASLLSHDEFIAASCEKQPPGGGANGGAVKTLYVNLEGVDSFAELATRMGFISDAKAGVPRTAYKGVVAIRHKGCRKLIAPRPPSPTPAPASDAAAEAAV